MSDKIFKVYEGTVDAFKATNLPTTYADRPVFIEGDSSGNGRAIFANGEYYANGDAMSERGWRFLKWNSGPSTEYWNRVAKIDALKNSNILLEVAVKGEYSYAAAICFYIDISSYTSGIIAISIHGGASSIGYNNGAITPMVTVDADLNVWIKLHNMNYTSRGAIRILYRTGNAESYGHVGTNESSTSFVYQLDAPSSTYLEGYGGLRYTISSGTYTLTGAVIDATAKDSEKLGGVTASNYVQSTGLKTINGQSLVGSGDITIEGGGSGMPLVDHGTGDTTFELTPNVFHKWGEVASLTLTLGAETAGVANQYTFEFASGSTATVLALPDSLKWADDNVPTIEANMIYQISILNGLAVVLKFKNVTLITFTVAGNTHTAVDGMTWGAWVDSEYNTSNSKINTNSAGVQKISYGAGDIMLGSTYVTASELIIANAQYDSVD